MMFGKLAYLGSFSRRSVVTIIGSFALSVSTPPSTSRVTVTILAVQYRPSMLGLLEASSADRPASVLSARRSSSMACLPRKIRFALVPSPQSPSDSFATRREARVVHVFRYVNMYRAVGAHSHGCAERVGAFSRGRPRRQGSRRREASFPVRRVPLPRSTARRRGSGSASRRRSRRLSGLT